VSSEDQPSLILHCFSVQFKAHLVGDGIFAKVRSNTLGTGGGGILGAARGLLSLTLSDIITEEKVMSRCAFHNCALAGLLLFCSQFLAQAQTVSSTTPGVVMTTGIVGVTSTQTARLNVLNLQPVIPGVAAVACPATLEFYDDTGAQLKQLVLTNISPASAASLVFKPAIPSTAVGARAQIRAVVFTPSTAATMNPGTGSGPTPMPFLPVRPGCSVMASLEIVDDATGVTHTLTTDLRAMTFYNIFPVMAAR
jgi:hypothetical protein